MALIKNLTSSHLLLGGRKIAPGNTTTVMDDDISAEYYGMVERGIISINDYDVALASAPITNSGGAAATGPAKSIEAGSYVLWLFGTWNGATLKAQASPDNGTTWFDIATASATANAMILLNLPKCKVRWNIASAGASTSLSANLSAVK